MNKDFDKWNIEKKAIHARRDKLLYREREVRWCNLGVNVGFEHDGTGEKYARPVLILKGYSRDVCLVLPLTTSTKENPYHISVGLIADREASVIISQLRLVETRRLDQRIDVLDKATFERIRKAVKDML